MSSPSSPKVGSNVGIAQQLHLSVKTVETHVAHVLQALDLDAEDLTANCRVQAAVQHLRAASRWSARARHWAARVLGWSA